MRGYLTGWLALLLLTSQEGRAVAAAPPTPSPERAVIRRAIQALGGLDLLTRRVAVLRRGALRYEADAAAGGEATETAVESLVPPGGRPLRLTYRSQPGSNAGWSEVIVVINGKKSWRSIDGRVQDQDVETETLQVAGHCDRVAGLIPLLTDRGFTLTTVPPVEVGGKPADGIRVSFAGKPDVHLYFDRATGLLVRSSVRFKKDGKEEHWETTREEYRDPTGARDEQVLKQAEVATNDRALLELLREQVATPARLARVKQLVAQLGDDAFAVREKAEADLLALGAVALPALRAAGKDSDLEVRRRARRLVWRIEKRAGSAVTAAAVHLLAYRRTPGAVKVLLDLLPTTEGDLADDIRAALAALAMRTGRPDPDLLAALAGKDAVRRAAAAAVLGRDGGAYLARPGRRLFLRHPLSPTKVSFAGAGAGARSLVTHEVIYYNRIDDRAFERP